MLYTECSRTFTIQRARGEGVWRRTRLLIGQCVTCLLPDGRVSKGSEGCRGTVTEAGLPLRRESAFACSVAGVWGGWGRGQPVVTLWLRVKVTVGSGHGASVCLMQECSEMMQSPLKSKVKYIGKREKMH